MLNITFNEYIKNYENRLNAYLAEYEDNTKSYFLHEELEKYLEYKKTLCDILKELNHCIKEKKTIKSSVASKLKEISLDAYNNLVSKVLIQFYEEEIDGEFFLPYPIPSLINIDKEKLQQYITSSSKIIEFITNQYTESINKYSFSDFIYRNKIDINRQLSLNLGSKAKEISEKTINKIDNIEVNDKNDYTKSTIIEYLEDIKDFINTQEDYNILVEALYTYFTTFKFPIIQKKINFNRVNKKKVGWALKEVYKNIKQDNLDIEYFRFAKENINLFENELIETTNFNKSKFYKIFTTNPDR